MQVLLKATEWLTDATDVGRDLHMPPLKAFMDDTTVLVNSLRTATGILSRLDTLIGWSRMKFKPAKSRSLSISKGKVADSVKFQISGQWIPTVSEEPVKSLGRWYDCSMKDTKQGTGFVQSAEDGLDKIAKTQLQGKFKVWILQFMLIPKLLWPLLVYEIGASIVEKVEKTINRHTRKWLGLPPGLTTVALYSKQSKLKLPFKSLVEQYKCGKVGLQMMLNHSTDACIKNSQTELKSGRKWQAAKATREAEESAKFKEVLGAVQVGRQGLGFG